MRDKAEGGWEPEPPPPPAPKSEWDLLAEIRDLLAAILTALKTPRGTV